MGKGVVGDLLKRGMRETSDIMKMFNILIGVVVTCVCTIVKTDLNIQF